MEALVVDHQWQSLFTQDEVAVARQKAAMRDRRRGSHTVFEVQVHVCWLTKYRYGLLVGEVAKRVPELVCHVCGANEVRWDDSRRSFCLQRRI